MRSILPLSLILSLFVFLGTTRARADILTYTDTLTASGSLDGTAFNNALVTLTLTGDTSTITSTIISGDTFLVISGPATVSVAGGGTDSLTDNIEVYSAPPSSPSAGFLDQTILSNIVQTGSAAFSGYNLSTPIGPVTSAQWAIGLGPFNTALGTFSWFPAGPTPDFSTFTATEATSAVPEPSSLLLLGTGLLGLMGTGLYKKRLA